MAMSTLFAPAIREGIPFVSKHSYPSLLFSKALVVEQEVVEQRLESEGQGSYLGLNPGS